MKYLKLSPPSNPVPSLLLFKLSSPCKVEVESDQAKLIPDDLRFVAEDIDRLKINRGTKFETLEKPMHVQFIWCDHFLINGW